jgi:hypothetical protein
MNTGKSLLKKGVEPRLKAIRLVNVRTLDDTN